ncbi:MAG: hypothetical protein ABIH87_01685 [bacterium]
MKHWHIFTNISWLIILSAFVAVDLAGIPSQAIGLVLLVVYFLLVSNWGKSVLVNLFDFSTKVWRTRILSGFLCFASLGWIGGIFVLFTRLSAFNIGAVFLINGLLWLFLSIWLGSGSSIEENSLDLELNQIIEHVPKAKIGVLIYLILTAIGFYLLNSSKTGQLLYSPWQAISGWYIYIFFIATLILGWLIFSKLNTRVLIFLMILHGLLLHAYLPLTHELLYGADQWRHLAVEAQIIQEKPINVILFDSSPKTFIQALNPGKWSYSQLWASEVIVARLLDFSLLSVNKWLVAILWSVLIPLLLFELSKIFVWPALPAGRHKKRGLLLIWLSFLFFPWQSLGSMTLPVSYGFLIWLLLIILLLKRMRSPQTKQIIILGVLLALSLFGYILYLILFVVAWILVELVNNINLKKIVFYPVLIFLTAVFVPLIEFLTKYSWFEGLNFLSQAKQFIGNIGAVYLAFGPRAHDILGGNMVFNQVPYFAFVINGLLYWRIWLIVFMVVIILLAVLGWVKLLNSRSKPKIWLALISAGLWISYFIGFYLLSGQKLLSRRLDLVLSLFLLLVIFQAINLVFLNKAKQSRLKTILAIILFSFAISASYSLGPDTKTVSTNDYKAMQYIWSEIKYDDNYCIIADTYPLLALEYFSAKKIIGGGFPINENFTQVERIDLFNQLNTDLNQDLNQDLITKAKKMTSANSCYFFNKDVVYKY